MTVKNIFAYKLFLSLNISYFNFLYVKIATPPEKSHPLFPSNPPLKAEVLSSPPFLKTWLEAQPPSPLQKGGGGAHYALSLQFQNVSFSVMEINGSRQKIFCEKVHRLHDRCFPNSFTIF